MRKRPTLSLEGASFIGAFEGFVSHCYDDGGRPGAGNCTIGYGHLVHYGPTTEADLRRWGTITRVQAARMMLADADPALNAIERTVKVNLTPGQIAALCSFAYNCGAGALDGRVGQTVNTKPRRWQIVQMRLWHARVAGALNAWDHVGGQVNTGLHRRREAEAFLFATGKYTRAEGNHYANS